ALFLSGILWVFADGLKDSTEGEMWQAISANLLMIHGGAGMLTPMPLGGLVPVPCFKAWGAREKRITGTCMAWLNGVLIVTAFGLYYLGSENLRPWLSNIHLAAGFALPIQLLIHIYLGRRRSVGASKPTLAANAPMRTP